GLTYFFVGRQRSLPAKKTFGPLRCGVAGRPYSQGESVMRFIRALLVVCVASCAMYALGQDDKPKFTIKEVMEKAHKSKLCGKVADGKGTKEEKDSLVEMYIALSQNKPPKGDAKEWETKTKALVEIAKECVKDDKAGGPKLKKALDCMGCHKAFKG